MTAELNNKAAEGMYSGIDFVLEYMEKRVDVMLKLLVGRHSAREQYMIGLYYLAKGWMQTLKKLDERKDLQAIMTCNRAMVEITVDLILLYRDSSRQTIRKMLHFDRYQKFKAARSAVTYFENKGIAVPDPFEEMANYVRKRKHQVEKKKKELWPKLKNIVRWSGNNLLTDIKEADRLLEHGIRDEINMSIEQYHETEYRRLHWYVHGSGLSGYWNMPADVFHLMCAMGFYWSCNFAMLCCKVLLTAFRFTDVAELDKEWERVKLARHTAFLDLNPHLQSQDGAAAVEAAKKMLGFGGDGESIGSTPQADQ
jgi:soluble cytochrome b562